MVTGRYGYYGRELPLEARRPRGDLVAIRSLHFAAPLRSAEISYIYGHDGYAEFTFRVIPMLHEFHQNSASST